MVIKLFNFCLRINTALWARYCVTMDCGTCGHFVLRSSAIKFAKKLEADGIPHYGVVVTDDYDKNYGNYVFDSYPKGYPNCEPKNDGEKSREWHEKHKVAKWWGV